MRIHEAKTFFEAYKNEKAKSLIKKMLVSNYTEGILLHHPHTESIDPAKISGSCQNLINYVFSCLDEIQDQPEKLFSLLHQLSRKNNQADNRWFDDFNLAYEHYKHHKKLYIRMEQLRPYLHGKSYCDLGCGGGDLVYFLKKNYRGFEEYAGIDVLDWRTDNIKNQINFQMLDFSQPDTESKNQYDTITCIAVLHHVGNTDESRSIFLRNIRNALTEGGRLIVEEDVILPKEEVESNSSFYQQVNTIRKGRPLFSDFVDMGRKDQRDAIILIDILANSLSGGVPEMAFPCGFKSISEWMLMFEENGFEVVDVNIQGFLKGIFNQSAHVFFVLKKP